MKNIERFYMKYSRFATLLTSMCLISGSFGCNSKGKDDNDPTVVVDPDSKNHPITVGSWSFLYPMPAEVFTLNEGRVGPMAEDLEGFVRVADTGEEITLGGSFSHRPCEELKGVFDSGNAGLDVDSPLRHGVYVTQTLRNDQYQLRVLAGFETDDGRECVSFVFHSRASYSKEIDFNAPSAVREAVIASLNSVTRK
jgi:hypothetical protein